MKTPSPPLTIDDPIVDEVREAGDEMAREANNDLHTLCERLREAERQHPERLLASPPAGRPSEEI